MNVNEASGVRELTADELDEVNGGLWNAIGVVLGLLGVYAHNTGALRGESQRTSRPL